MINLDKIIFLLGAIAVIEIYRAWRLEELVKEIRKRSNANWADIASLLGSKFDSVFDKLYDIAHDTQQIKTGDEWSKKREKKILKAVDKRKIG